MSLCCSQCTFRSAIRAPAGSQYERGFFRMNDVFGSSSIVRLCSEQCLHRYRRKKGIYPLGLKEGATFLVTKQDREAFKRVYEFRNSTPEYLWTIEEEEEEVPKVQNQTVQAQNELQEDGALQDGREEESEEEFDEFA